MDQLDVFYFCPVCFEASAQRPRQHGHVMLYCDVGTPGDVRRLPDTDREGRMRSRAPHWFLELKRGLNDAPLARGD